MTIPTVVEGVELRSQFERNRDEAADLMLNGVTAFLRDLGQRQVRFWDAWLAGEIV